MKLVRGQYLERVSRNLFKTKGLLCLPTLNKIKIVSKLMLSYTTITMRDLISSLRSIIIRGNIKQQLLKFHINLFDSVWVVFPIKLILIAHM